MWTYLIRIKKSCLSEVLVQQKRVKFMLWIYLYASLSHKDKLFKTYISDNAFVLKTCMKI